MEDFTTGYCADLNDQNDGIIAEFSSTIIPVNVDGVEVSDTFFITCPWCNRNVMFLTTVSNYDMRCDKCGKGIWGQPQWTKSNG